MIKRVVALLLLSVQLFSYQYDETLLNIEAKLFPKMAILEQNIKKKNRSVLSLVIVSEDVDYQTAKNLRKKMLEMHPEGLLNKKLEVEVKSINDVLHKNIDALIVLYLDESKLRYLTSWANRHRVLSFSYDPSDLDHGVIASLYIGKSTKPYLNTKLIKKYQFSFDSYLLRLSKFKN